MNVDSLLYHFNENKQLRKGITTMLPIIFKRTGSLLPSMDDFIERFIYGWPSFERGTETTWTPRTDVHETEKEILIDAGLPGIDKKDIKVEVKNNVLTISGERKEERKTDEKNYYRFERHYGKFERSFGLPETVKPEKVSASFNNGVLTVTLPKTEKAKAKEIPVEVK